MLREWLRGPGRKDTNLGRDTLPGLVREGRVYAYRFGGYWEDAGTIQAYYEANMDLISVSPQLNLYNYRWPILTNQGNLPPAKTVFDDEGRRGQNLDSLVCGGCITSGAVVRQSVLGPSCRVHSYALVEGSILFENVDIGRHARIRNAIIDENICVPEASRTEWTPEPSETSMRVFSIAEQDHLGADCLGFLSFLEGAGELHLV